MDRVDTPQSVNGQWKNGNPLAGVLGTVIGADYMNDLMEELVGGLIEYAGLTPAKFNQAQVREAITWLIEVDQLGGFLAADAPYDVSVGDGVLIGDTFGRCELTATTGNPTQSRPWGVHTFAKYSPDSMSPGVRVYWDDTNRRFTTTASGNRGVGLCHVEALPATTTVSVRVDRPGAPVEP